MFSAAKQILLLWKTTLGLLLLVAWESARAFTRALTCIWMYFYTLQVLLRVIYLK